MNDNDGLTAGECADRRDECKRLMDSYDAVISDLNTYDDEDRWIFVQNCLREMRADVLEELECMETLLPLVRARGDDGDDGDE